MIERLAWVKDLTASKETRKKKRQKKRKKDVVVAKCWRYGANVRNTSKC